MPRGTEMVLILVVAAAAYTDLRARRIPNVIPALGASLGLALHAWERGAAGAWTSLEGAMVGLGLFVVFYVAGGMGAGDVKLFAAVGALVGPQPLVLVFVFTGLLGGIAALAVVMWRKNWRATLPYGAVIAAGTFVFLICNVIGY